MAKTVVDPKKVAGEADLAEVQAYLDRNVHGTDGEMPLEHLHDRMRGLESPAYFATKILDSWYERHFEPRHYELLDDVLKPWLLGETVKIEGATYDPNQYTGLGVLWSRSTIKSTMLRIIINWIHLYRRLVIEEDARTMLCHQVLDKAIEHSEAIRETARTNTKFRQCYPEFKAPPGEWDRKNQWRWPNFETKLATEYSLVCYGETSSKTGGHYTERIIDDWVTDESVTTPLQLENSVVNFRKMDNLRDRSRPYNPWILAGTHYHFQDCYKQLERTGGWLFWKVPAHTGSAKRIFDLCGINDRTDEGRRKIELGLRKLESDPPGTLNFPHLLSWRELYRTARATNRHIYNTQIQLDPVPEDEQRFDALALKECWLPPGLEHLPRPDECYVYVRCDPAISRKREADECAILVAMVKWNAYRYHVDGWIGREKRPTAIVRKCFTLARKWQARGYTVHNIGIEAVSMQEALAQLCRDGVPEREARYHGESIPVLTKPCAIRSINRSADMRKEERILEMDGPISRREVWWWESNPVAAKLHAQHVNFPYDRDDGLDAAHDFWVATMSPPRPMEGGQDEMHPIMKKILKRAMTGQEQAVVDGHHTVQLATWRNA